MGYTPFRSPFIAPEPVSVELWSQVIDFTAITLMNLRYLCIYPKHRRTKLCAMSIRCPLYPQKRTCAVQLGMSALCQ